MLVRIMSGRTVNRRLCGNYCSVADTVQRLCCTASLGHSLIRQGQNGHKTIAGLVSGSHCTLVMQRVHAADKFADGLRNKKSCARGRILRFGLTLLAQSPSSASSALSRDAEKGRASRNRHAYTLSDLRRDVGQLPQLHSGFASSVGSASYKTPWRGAHSRNPPRCRASSFSRIPGTRSGATGCNAYRNIHGFASGLRTQRLSMQ